MLKRQPMLLVKKKGVKISPQKIGTSELDKISRRMSTFKQVEKPLKRKDTIKGQKLAKLNRSNSNAFAGIVDPITGGKVAFGSMQQTQENFSPVRRKRTLTRHLKESPDIEAAKKTKKKKS